MTALEYITNLERKRKWNSALETTKERGAMAPGGRHAIASVQFGAARRIKGERPAAAKIR